MTFKTGDRVKLTEQVEHFDLGIWPAGLTGTIAEIDGDPLAFDGGIYWVKLDSHFPQLTVWSNQLQVDVSEGDRVPLRLITGFDVDAVQMSDIADAVCKDDLDEAIAPLQRIAGIKYGDVAAQVFSDIDNGDWAKLNANRRTIRVLQWLETERAFLDTKGQ